MEVGQLRSLDLSVVSGIDDERCVGDMKFLESFSAPLIFSSLDILPSSVTNLCFKLTESNANKSFEHLSNLKGLDVWAPMGRIDFQSRCAQVISKHTKLETLMLQGDWAGVDSLEFLSQMPLKRLRLERVAVRSLANVDLSNLEYLAINWSLIRSVEDMGVMPKLRELDLLNFPVYPISPITVERWCPSLEMLTCDGNIPGESKTWVRKHGEWK
jgi:hypothetical protein